MININKLIKDERIKRGWSQGFLAKILGCNQTFISLIELEKRDTPNWIIEKCLEIFDIEFKDFCTVTAKTFYIKSINNMIKHLDVDKLKTIKELTTWALIKEKENF